MTPEARLKAKIREYLKSRGAHVFTRVATGYGPSGVDMYACYLGQFIAIEAKVWPRKPTKLQLNELRLVDLAGGWTAVAYDLVPVEKIIRDIDRDLLCKAPQGSLPRARAQIDPFFDTRRDPLNKRYGGGSR